MDEGNILTEGTPREVFSQVELLKQHHLDVPQATGSWPIVCAPMAAEFPMEF